MYGPLGLRRYNPQRDDRIVMMMLCGALSTILICVCSLYIADIYHHGQGNTTQSISPTNITKSTGTSRNKRDLHLTPWERDNTQEELTPAANDTPRLPDMLTGQFSKEFNRVPLLNNIPVGSCHISSTTGNVSIGKVLPPTNDTCFKLDILYM
ncbi:hypothetical protein FKM82_020077 [Ascaphus truei]